MNTAENVFTCIRDIRPGMKNINVHFIILDAGKTTITKDNSVVKSFKIADKSGSMNLSVWNEIGEAIQPGDIYRLSKGHGSIYKGSLTLYVGKGGDIQKLGEFCMLFSEVPNMSEPSQDFIPKPENETPKTPSQLSPNNGNFPSTSNVSDISPAFPQNSSKTPQAASSNNQDQRKPIRPGGQSSSSNNGNTSSNQSKPSTGRKTR